MSYLFYSVVVCIGMIVLYQLIKGRCLLSGAFFNVFTGVGTLVTANLFGYLLGIHVPVTLFSCCLCAVMGVPGTALIIAAKYICGI